MKNARNARNSRKSAGEIDEATLLDLLVGPRVLASFLGVTERQLSNLVSNGTIPAPRGRGQYELVASVRAYCRSRSGAESSGAMKTLASERARLTKTKADRAELEQRRLLGEYGLISEFEAAKDAINAVIYQRILAVVPRAAPRLAICSTAVGCAEILREELYQALDDISETSIEIVVEEDAGDHAV